MPDFILRGALVVNEGKIFYSDIYIRKGRIEKIAPQIGNIKSDYADINAEQLTLIPGVIDGHVHFREPGLTHKADIRSESYAAVAGGVTSFIEMPNTQPKTTTINELNRKFSIASMSSLANYSFYMGATNDNINELLLADKSGAAGVKVFLGASTGNMLVDNETIIDDIFSKLDTIITVHAEDEEIIHKQLKHFQSIYGDNIPYDKHADIRPAEACLKATEKAVSVALKHNTRLHIAHLSTEEEVVFLNNTQPVSAKRITAEGCVNHLYFNSNDYNQIGGQIKCNPSIKDKKHQEALLAGLIEGKIDMIATDHAPHTFEEKQMPYTSCPSGIPLVQHSLQIMFDFHQKGIISKTQITDWMCHQPAILFGITERGFIREGYCADLCLLNENKAFSVKKDNIFYKCGWSPLEGKTFQSSVFATFVNGQMAYLENKNIAPSQRMKLVFKR